MEMLVILSDGVCEFWVTGRVTGFELLSLAQRFEPDCLLYRRNPSGHIYVVVPH
jgi:hypothetical protein